MSKIKVNYKSDLPPIEITFKVNNVAVDVPDHDFVLRFFVDGCDESYYCGCRYVESEDEEVEGLVPEYSRCAPISNGSKLTCYINNHKFTPGRLRVEMIDLAANENYEDGIKKTVVPDILDVYLVEGVGDEVDNVVADTFEYKVGRGILSVAKTATVGVVDTYTITFDDGTTTTYTVTNGRDGVNLGDAAIADDLVTNDSTKVLSAKQGKILGDRLDLFYETVEYDDDDLTKGKIIALQGEYARNVSSESDWGYMGIEVTKGDILTIATKGGVNSRAWALTDTSRLIYSVAAASTNTSASPVTLVAQCDGWLFVNCKNDTYYLFSITRKYNKTLTDVSELSEGLTLLNAQVGESLKVALYGTANFIESAPSKGQFWNLSGGVGTIAPSETTAFGTTKWQCLPKTRVYYGQKITVSTVGGGNARAYALTDMSGRILVVADAPVEPATEVDLTSDPVTLDVSQNGYLYVNCNTENNPNFFVKVSIDVPEALGSISGAASVAFHAPQFNNNPLPLWKDTLKVLAIGNSYTDDSTYYLGSLVDAANISGSKLCVYYGYQGGSSLEAWVNNIEDNVLARVSGTRSFERRAGSITMENGTIDGSGSGASNGKTVRDVLAQDWDVVVIQQFSALADSYSTFNPYLGKMVAYIRKYCTNPKVAVAWHSVWSYKEGYSSGGVTYGDSEERWASICEATKEMSDRDGIDIIIPTGTAIQNARGTTLNTDGEMTRDGTHLAFGVGRYTAACTWFQTLISPMFGIDVIGNPATHAIAPNETGGSYEAVAVTDENKRLCQLCAFAATARMWEVSDVANETISDYNPTYLPSLYDRVAAVESGKQATLVSGTNIKTINNESLLGSGNITIQGGGGGSSVQSDWNESDDSSMAFIKNKPTIPAAQVQSNWNESDTSSKAYIQNKPTIPAAQVNADWDASSGVAQILNKPTIPTIPATATQSEVDVGSSTSQRTFTPQLLHDNAYIVEEDAHTTTPSVLKANKMYDFGTVSTALTIPSLDATNDLVSNALNFYALRFIAGADNLSITFPSGVQVDDEPTINTGDYVEIMINLYVVNGVNNFYASIKVWQAQ